MTDSDCPNTPRRSQTRPVVAQLEVTDIDFERQVLLVRQGKGQKFAWCR